MDRVSDRPLPVGSLLRTAPPDRLAETPAAHLRETSGAERVEVFLADLTMSTLRPVLDGERVTDEVEALFASVVEAGS